MSKSARWITTWLLVTLQVTQVPTVGSSQLNRNGLCTNRLV